MISDGFATYGQLKRREPILEYGTNNPKPKDKGKFHHFVSYDVLTKFFKRKIEVNQDKYHHWRNTN